MGWKEKIKEWGGGDMTFLSEDGECCNFVVVADPILIEGTYKNKPSVKIACPVVTEDGFELLIAGKRLARKISKYEDQFQAQAFTAIRHGAADDPSTRYELKTIDDPTMVQRLFDIAKKEFKAKLIPEAVAAVKEVMKG